MNTQKQFIAQVLMSFLFLATVLAYTAYAASYAFVNPQLIESVIKVGKK